jgi:hypothetical protein
MPALPWDLARYCPLKAPKVIDGISSSRGSGATNTKRRTSFYSVEQITRPSLLTIQPGGQDGEHHLGEPTPRSPRESITRSEDWLFEHVGRKAEASMTAGVYSSDKFGACH